MWPFAVPTIKPPSGGPSHDADVTAWVSAVVTTGGSVSSGRRTLLDALLAGLKSDGVWALLDYLAILAAEDAPSALIELRGLRSLTAVNSPAFTIDRGYAGNGVSSYLRSGFDAATAGQVYARNSAHLAAYNRTTRSTNPGASLGLVGSLNNSFIYPTDTDLKTYVSIQSGLNVHNGATTNASGFWVVDRSSSTACTVRRNGASYLSYSQASVAIVGEEFYIGCTNNTGAVDFSTDQCAAMTAGGHMTATQQDALYGRLQTYMTAIGAQV